MRRRSFVLVGGSAAALSRTALAQKAPAKIGWLYAGSRVAAAKDRQRFFLDGLRSAGLVEGRDFVIELRYAGGHYDRFSAQAEELAKSGASILVVSTIAAARAAQQVNPPLPVVMT